MIREPTFKIDEALINAHIKDYDRWLNTDHFENTKNCKRFMNQLKHTINHECKSIDDIKQMLKIMNELQFNQKFINLINDLQSLKHSLIDNIGEIKNNNFNNSEITKIFQEYQYPIGLFY